MDGLATGTLVEGAQEVQGDLIHGSSGYRAIYADPPWRFRTWSETNQAKSPSRHYDLMTTEDLKRLPVGEMAAPDAALFMWAVNPMIPQALDVMAAWGFKYATVAFTWAKRTPTDRAWHFGLGYWTRQNTEQCLLGVRGKPKVLKSAGSVRQLIVEPRREHSRKPDRVRADIESLISGPYLELFARSTAPGWDSWGNQTDRFGDNPSTDQHREDE